MVIAYANFFCYYVSGMNFSNYSKKGEFLSLSLSLHFHPFTLWSGDGLLEECERSISLGLVMNFAEFLSFL